MLKAIGIAGSPRKHGNSASLLKAALEGAASAGAVTQHVYLNDLVFRGCQGCLRCETEGTCILDDDLTPVQTSLAGADLWLLASPIYYDGVSGQMKTFFDRCRWLTMEGKRPRLRGKRRAAVIVTYEDAPRDDYARVADVLVRYLSWMGEDFGDVKVICEGRLGPPDAVSKRPELLLRAEETGRMLVEDLLRNAGNLYVSGRWKTPGQ